MFGSCFSEVCFSVNLEGLTGSLTSSPQAFIVPGKLTVTRTRPSRLCGPTGESEDCPDGTIKRHTIFPFSKNEFNGCLGLLQL